MSGKRIAGIVMIALALFGEDMWDGLFAALSDGQPAQLVMNLVLIGAGVLCFLPDRQHSR